jgi:hypothetical protein
MRSVPEKTVRTGLEGAQVADPRRFSDLCRLGSPRPRGLWQLGGVTRHHAAPGTMPKAVCLTPIQSASDRLWKRTSLARSGLMPGLFE